MIADATVPGIRTSAGKGGFDSLAGERALKSRLRRSRRSTALARRRAPSSQPRAACSPISTRPRRAPASLLDAPRRIARASHMAIDAATRDSLELTRSIRPERAGSLLGEIDRCQTAAGRRLLCEDISAPLTDRQSDRSAAGARRLAARRCDPPHARACRRSRRCPTSHAASLGSPPGAGSPRDLALLRDGFDAADALKTELWAKPERPPLLDNLLPRLGGHGALVDLLSRALVASPPIDASKGGYIAEGYDPALDALRDAASNGRRAIAALEARYRDATGVGSLKIRHNAVLGYHIEVSARHADRLMAPDSGFTHRQTLAGVVRFNSPELHEEAAGWSKRARHALAAEAAHAEELTALAVAAAPQITATAEAIARIDVAACHAQRAAEGGWALRTSPTRRASRSKPAAIRWSKPRFATRRALRRQRSARSARTTGCG